MVLRQPVHGRRADQSMKSLIIIDGKPRHRISSNYVKNYDTIRAQLKKKLTILEIDDFENMRSIVKDKVKN
jgi:hypothetical protein